MSVVKVLQAPPEMLLDTFAMLLPPQQQTLPKFTLLLEMKVGAGMWGQACSAMPV